MAAILTAVVVFHTCTSSAILEIQDPVMFTNLLLPLLEFLLKTAELLHRWLKKIQNIHNGVEPAYINTCIPYTV